MGLFSSPNDKAIELIYKLIHFPQEDAFSQKNFSLLEKFIDKHSEKPEKCRVLWEIYLLCAICYDTGIATDEDKEKAAEYYTKVKELLRYHTTPDSRNFGLSFVEARLGAKMDCYLEKNHISEKALIFRSLGYASLVSFKKNSSAFLSKTQWKLFWEKAKLQTQGDSDCQNVCETMLEIFEIYNSTKKSDTMFMSAKFIEQKTADDFVLLITSLCYGKGNDSPFPLSDMFAIMNKERKDGEYIENPEAHSKFFLFRSAVNGNLQATIMFYKETLKRSVEELRIWTGAKDDNELSLYLMHIYSMVLENAPEAIQ